MSPELTGGRSAAAGPQRLITTGTPPSARLLSAENLERRTENLLGLTHLSTESDQTQGEQKGWSVADDDQEHLRHDFSPHVDRIPDSAARVIHIESGY